MAQTKKGHKINLEVSIPEGADADWDLLLTMARRLGIIIRDNDMTLPEQKSQKLKADLGIYQFESLPAIKNLSVQERGKLYSLFISQQTPYMVAMLDHLGFFDQLFDEYCKTIGQMHNTVAEILGVCTDTVERNYNSLRNDKSTKTERSLIRYTAYRFKKSVVTDFNRIKKGSTHY